MGRRQAYYTTKNKIDPEGHLDHHEEYHDLSNKIDHAHRNIKIDKSKIQVSNKRQKARSNYDYHAGRVFAQLKAANRREHKNIW